MSTFTADLNLELVARNADVGTWDTPTNANWTIVDIAIGGNSAIALNNSNVILNAVQMQSKTLTLNSTLTGNVQLTFPTSFVKSYEIQNQCTGSSAFTITLATTASGGQFVSAPPGEITEIFCDGTNVKFKNLGRIGSYVDFAGSSVPNWVTNCAVPPYLNCDGSTFSAVTYPALAVILGGTTLPDRRGNVGATLNQGTSRMTAASGGVDGNTIRTLGGVDAVALATSQLPSHSHGVTDPGHLHSLGGTWIGGVSEVGSGGSSPPAIKHDAINIGPNSVAAVTGISIQAAGSGLTHTSMQPTVITGIVMIRAG